MRTAHTRSISPAGSRVPHHPDRLLSTAVDQILATTGDRVPAGQVIAAVARASVRVMRVASAARVEPLSADEHLSLVVGLATLDLDRAHPRVLTSVGG